jgi:DNA-directed RNA polymerase specialized sigma24 family protein
MRRCSPCLRISEDAEDVAQDALLKALAPFESVSQRVELRDLADSDSDQ